MPFGIHKHSNRSRQALNDPALSSAPLNPPVGPSGHLHQTPPRSFGSRSDDLEIDPFQQPNTPSPEGHYQPYNQSQPSAPESGDPRSFQHSNSPSSGPSRSQSTRYSVSSSAYQHLSSPSSQAGASVDDLLQLDAHRLQEQQYQHQQRAHEQQQYEQQQQALHQQQRTDSQRYDHQRYTQPAPQPPAEHKKSKSIFDRMRSGRENRLSQELNKPPPASYNNSNSSSSGLVRRLSKRQENPPPIRTVQQNSSLDHRLSSARNSRSHLPSPQEFSGNNGSDLDPHLIRETDQQTSHSATQELGQHQIIRAVESEGEPNVYPVSEDGHHQYQSLTQPQQTAYPGQHQPDSGTQGHYEIQNHGHPQHHFSLQPGFISHDPFRQQNSETVSQLSYDSPVEQRDDQQRPPSVQSNGQSPTSFGPSRVPQYPDRTTSIQGTRPLSQATVMAPTSGASHQNRRSADPKSIQVPQGQGETRDAPPTYTRGQNYPSNQPPTPGLGPPSSSQGPNYRGGPPQRDQYGTATPSGEQGRSTPPPQPGPDVADAYKELQIKYKKVKGLYFDKTAQVEQLQNTLANQRLSQSRTSLDDSEYMTRFQRLDGATTNLAFNIRKDWRSVPPWLSQYVNQDAMKIGKQEMTAVGRACITKFLVDDVFNRTFHPGLETGLSLNLRTIEQNIRRFSPALNNQEESDALTSKVVQWRLATLEGLRDVLSSPESEDHRRDFSRAATTRLTASLINYLQEPIPAGLEDSAAMIVELAVSIAANLPLESRDLSISYPMPGDLLQTFLMKVETGIPPLDHPGADTNSEIDASSTGSGDRDEKESDGGKRKEKKGGMLQAMMGGSSSGSSGKKPSISSQGGIEGPSESKSKVSSEDGTQKVRFSGFVGLEVRGRQVLGKAPVWTVG
ncbi:hypothetical protein HYALB_00000819 [Hymenoscyphus albidus]|uniref:Uncharacterized protein n=1 Tax=Hymenoscyphus albidus TaxID=595503 RepID=A0A9N9LDT7_9HELO|nr:hypothetical protein HYALB_00000819 [Hymenoscyphus albidus]